MSARERILGRLSRAHAVTNPAPSAAESLAPGRRGPPTGPDPVRPFVERARRLGSDVVEVRSRTDVPAAASRYLEERRLERSGAVWPALGDLPWHAAGLALEARAANGSDPVGVTGAFAALAETGTLMLLSGSATPASVSLLPETHIAVVLREQIVATMEQAWARLRAAHGGAPRAVNFVSGPSRTADVEQTITVGAHGPRRVLIVLVES